MTEQAQGSAHLRILSRGIINRGQQALSRLATGDGARRLGVPGAKGGRGSGCGLIVAACRALRAGQQQIGDARERGHHDDERCSMRGDLGGRAPNPVFVRQRGAAEFPDLEWLSQPP